MLAGTNREVIDAGTGEPPARKIIRHRVKAPCTASVSTQTRSLTARLRASPQMDEFPKAGAVKAGRNAEDRQALSVPAPGLEPGRFGLKVGPKRSYSSVCGRFDALSYAQLPSDLCQRRSKSGPLTPVENQAHLRVGGAPAFAQRAVGERSKCRPARRGGEGADDALLSEASVSADVGWERGAGVEVFAA